ncbi:MAG: hypothetical protein WC855_09120 [Thermodesulfovibrionales bacterium]
MGFLKNISINLKATEAAAVLIAWVMGITLLGIFGKDSIAYAGMGILGGTGALLIKALGQNINGKK